MRKMLEVRPSGRLDTPEARHARSGPGRTFLSPGLWLMRQSGWGCGPIDDEQRRRLVRKRSAANSLEEFLSRWLLPRSAPVRLCSPFGRLLRRDGCLFLPFNSRLLCLLKALFAPYRLTCTAVIRAPSCAFLTSGTSRATRHRVWTQLTRCTGRSLWMIRRFNMRRFIILSRSSCIHMCGHFS